MKIYVKKNAVEGGWGVFKASKHVLKMALKQGGGVFKRRGVFKPNTMLFTNNTVVLYTRILR